MIKAEEIVKKLASFPNRGVATKNEPKVVEYLCEILSDFRVEKEEFSTPKTYISIVWWLIGGLIFGLLLQNYSTFIGMLIVLVFILFSFLYFNWFASPITQFPPLVKSQNLIVRADASTQTSKKMILMAHYDTAPISFLYLSSQVKNFRFSLNFSIFLMLFAAVYSIVIYLTNTESRIGTYLFVTYFFIQGITGTIDFFRLGYSVGASDNATGVAAAICTFQSLAKSEKLGINLELVLTGAEEVGMIGARDYYLKHKKDFNQDTFLINFDTLGNGKLKVIIETGSLINIKYDNKLTKISEKITSQNPDYKEVITATWHTADFDSVWFQRAGMPTLTLAALDENGKMPNIHRPEDTLENINFKPMNQAIKLAIEISNQI